METAFRPLDADDGRRRPQATARPGLAAKLSRLLHGFPEALAAEVAEFLDEAPVAETMAAKLSRLLHEFPEGDVLPQAERAADLGLDPTPLLAVVSELLRLYADALRLPDPTGL